MRKLIPVLIVAALILSLLAACTTTAQSVTPTPSTDADDAQTPSPTEQGEDNVIIVKENTQSNGGNVVDDMVLVQLSIGETRKFLTYSPDDFPEIDAVSISEGSLQETLDYVKAVLNGETPTHHYNIDVDTFQRWLIIKLSTHDVNNVFRAIELLSIRPEIEYAQPCYNYAPDIYSITDYYYSSQWGLDRINVSSAWNNYITGGSVLVGVIDDGIEGSHPDLCNQLVSLHMDFTTSEDGTSITHPTSVNHHGTAVAGIIAAQANNGTYEFNGGVVGTAFNAGLVSLKANTGPQIKKAIEYANNHGIAIVNLSQHIAEYDSFVASAINAYDGLVICSAGNNNININPDENFITPASLDYDNIIVVGASDKNNEIWCENSSVEGSNYGNISVDLFAPGIDIHTTYYAPSSNPCTAEITGTSFATPFVTGVAALLLSNNPNMTAEQIKAHILKNVSVVPQSNSIYYSCSSHGILNVNNVFTINLSGYVDIGDDTYHYAKCTVCNGAHELNNRQQHGYSGNYSFYNNKNHSQNCLDCTHKVLSSHISGGGYTNQGTNVGHKTNCSVCGFDYIEAHSWLYNNAFGCYICRKCPARSYNGQSPYGYHDKEMQ